MLHPASKSKTTELIVYIATRLKDKSNYGSVLLNKALCLIDYTAYLRNGESITDLIYIKQRHGPTPEPRRFLILRDMLVVSGDIEKLNAFYFGKQQIKYVAKRAPNINIFEKQEIALINEVLDSICNQNATEISDYTHNFLAWIIAQEKEELPLYTFLLTNKEQPDSTDYRWAEQVMAKYQSSSNKVS